MVKAVVADTTTDGKRTTLSPSLKMMAAERETTIAAIIHEWIQEHLEKESEQVAHVSEYDVESLFIDRLESIGYRFVEMANYDDVLANFRERLTEFNARKLVEAKGEAALSDAEFGRVMIHMDNKSVYESAKILRDKYVLALDNGKTVYLDFFSSDTDRNIYQVTHQVTMDKEHKDDVAYKNRYDVTILINGLPVVQVELKRPGVEINEAINQINRYRKFSFKGLFRYLQLFVVSNSVQTKYFCNENEMGGGSYNPILKSLVFFWTDDKNRRINKLDEFTADFLRRSTITEMLDKYMVIKTTEPVLMVMRPYQIYAVKAAKRRVLESNQNGYVFACTGSGKTLTSFKLAQLLRDEPRVDKVIFLIDRKDLDDQTVDEYNSFEKGCVDGSDSTAVLVKQLGQADRGLIVTTIQKMANAVKGKRYERLMDSYRDKKVVFIIDECHRSQFGKMHGDIERHFRNANYIGFTGTPIFEANKGKGGRTTADVFYSGSKLDSCLHRYMIKDAIADGNVLRSRWSTSGRFSRSRCPRAASTRSVSETPSIADAAIWIWTPCITMTSASASSRRTSSSITSSMSTRRARTCTRRCSRWTPSRHSASITTRSGS